MWTGRLAIMLVWSSVPPTICATALYINGSIISTSAASDAVNMPRCRVCRAAVKKSGLTITQTDSLPRGSNDFDPPFPPRNNLSRLVVSGRSSFSNVMTSHQKVNQLHIAVVSDE